MPDSAGDRRARRRDRRRRHERRRRPVHRPRDAGHRAQRPVRHAGIHRGARPLHRPRREQAQSRAPEHEELGRDRAHGRARGREGEARRVDHRARLAPGEMELDAAAERRRVSDPRVARQGLAEQSGDPHARERPRVVRQREGDAAVEHHRRDRQSRRRRNPEGREGAADRPAPRNGVGPHPPRRRRADADRGRNRSARIPGPRAGGSRGDFARASRVSRTPGRQFEVVNRVKRMPSTRAR